MSFKWSCPYCGMTQTVVDEQVTISVSSLEIAEQAEGPIGIKTTAVGCSNKSCLKTTVDIEIGRVRRNADFSLVYNAIKPITKQRILPRYSFRKQPDYIPKVILNDYYEACLIRELSPKASATLIRRCLQGMIRDFAGIRKSRLIDEIEALRKSVSDGSASREITSESVDAIDHVRGVGNIGAHMEKDIDQIIDVDPGEAQALIELVESLFEDWYVGRERRRERFRRVSEIAEIKEGQKSAGKAPASSTRRAE